MAYALHSRYHLHFVVLHPPAIEGIGISNNLQNPQIRGSGQLQWNLSNLDTIGTQF